RRTRIAAGRALPDRGGYGIADVGDAVDALHVRARAAAGGERSVRVARSAGSDPRGDTDDEPDVEPRAFARPPAHRLRPGPRDHGVAEGPRRLHAGDREAQARKSGGYSPCGKPGEVSANRVQRARARPVTSTGRAPFAPRR